MTISPEWHELVDSLSRQGGVAVLVFARALGCFAFLPAFAANTFPSQVRAALPIVMLPVLMAGAGVLEWPAPPLSWSLVPRAGLEFVIGVAVSLPACVLFWAARGAGELIDNQTGANNQEMFSAMTNGADGPAAQLFVQLALLGFLSAGGLHELVRTLWVSYAALAPGVSSGVDGAAVFPLAQALLSQTVTLALRIGMPLVALFLLVELGMGVAARSMQQLPLPAIASAVKSLLLPLALLIVLQAWGDYLRPPALPSVDVLQPFQPPGVVR